MIKAKAKTFITVAVAAVMALTMFTGISFAEQVSGAKAECTDFGTIFVSWDAVVIEVPQDAAAQSDEPEMPDVDEPEMPDVDEPEMPEGEETEDCVVPIDELESEELSAEDVDAAASEAVDEILTEPVDELAAEGIDEPMVEPEMEAEAADEGEPQYEEITYEVYRATSKTGKYKLVATTEETSYTDSGLTPGKTYYYRIDFQGSNGSSGTSKVISTKVITEKTADMTMLMKGKEPFDYRIDAGQRLYAYDTLQGACANGGYAYLTLYDRKVEKCKIVKVKLSDLSIVKVSKSLPVYHGNNLTFNTKKKQIVATCCTTIKKGKYRAVFIDPKTLKVISTKDVKLTKKVKKLPKKVRKKYNGYTAIAYNEKHNCYVARLRSNGNAVIFDKNMKPLRYITLSGKKTGLLVQGMESVGDYIYDVRSFKGKNRYCMVTIHDMSGKFVGQMRFPILTSPGYELQNIFHDGKQFYAGFYYSTSQMDDTQQNHVLRVNRIYRLNNL